MLVHSCPMKPFCGRVARPRLTLETVWVRAPEGAFFSFHWLEENTYFGNNLVDMDLLFGPILLTVRLVSDSSMRKVKGGRQ